MAKKRASAGTVRVVQTRAPSPTIRVVAPGPIKARAKRVARRAGGVALGTSGFWVPIVASWLLGKAKQQGTSIPTIIPGLGPAANAGVIALGVGKFLKVRQATLASIGFLSVAAYSHGMGQGIGGDGGEGRAVVWDDD